jgi:hypothetical protein
MFCFPVVSAIAPAHNQINTMPIAPTIPEDLDPLDDVEVTVEINQIRTLETKNLRFMALDKIDRFSDPDFYVKVTINDAEFTSPVWENTKYVYNPEWSATLNVPDDVDLVNITIQLWDANPGGDTLCDISNNFGTVAEAKYLILQYSIEAGHWFGDDYLDQGQSWEGPDPSGYGRANGCDDNSIYQDNRDCELWFNIYQNDFDGDGIPYWTEVNVFGTDPEVNNIGEDNDSDGCPIEWEYKWGYTLGRGWGNDSYQHRWVYNPNVWDDHETLDPDEDGLTNVEEYLTSQWVSDPFRPDLFVEMDQMEGGPNGEPASIFPDPAKELLQTAYDKHNIVYHLDDGNWEDSGSEMIPFDNLTEMSWGQQDNELNQIYTDYFLHGDPNNWRRGVFHYGVVIYQCSAANGNAFGSNCFQISSNGLNEKAANPLLRRDIVYASAYMHETGHTLDIANAGVDNENTKSPLYLDWWRYRPYKSVMNYGYMFQMVDYSDGSRGLNDFADWNDLDLTYFEQSHW